MIRLEPGTYALYKGLSLKCSIDGDSVLITTSNEFIALLLGQSVSKWRIKPYEARVPIARLKELYTIKREFLFMGGFYPIFNETDTAINVRIPMEIVEREGIREYNDPRDPIVTFQKTGNETIRETKAILHPVGDTQIRIIGPAGGRT